MLAGTTKVTVSPESQLVTEVMELTKGLEPLKTPPVPVQELLPVNVGVSEPKEKLAVVNLTLEVDPSVEAKVKEKVCVEDTPVLSLDILSETSTSAAALAVLGGTSVSRMLTIGRIARSDSLEIFIV